MKKFLLGLLSLTLILPILTSCNSHPSQIYAKSSQANVYLTVPYGWKKISETELSKRERLSKASGAADRADAVIWQEAYSPSTKISAKDVFALDAPKSPIVFVRVRNLLPDEINAVSYNFLRDVFVPLTTWLKSSSNSSSSPLPMTDFSMENEIEFVAKNAHGVRSTFTFAGEGDSSQTFDQTAVVSDDRTIMYILLVRSENSSFNKNRKILEKVANSLTIRGAK